MAANRRDNTRPRAHDLKRARTEASSISTAGSISSAFKSLFKSSSWQNRQREKHDGLRARALPKLQEREQWHGTEEGYQRVKRKGGQPPLSPRPPKNFGDVHATEIEAYYRNDHHADDEQFHRTDVAMEIEGEVIRDHLSASHDEIESRIKESRCDLASEGKKEAEAHLLTTPPESLTKYKISIRNNLANFSFSALVARDRSLHGLESDLQALRDWWKTNYVLWTSNKRVVNDINDTIQQYKYHLSARGMGSSTLGVPNQITLQKKKKDECLEWFRNQRQLMDGVYHRYKRIKAQVEAAVFVVEDNHNPVLDPDFSYENDATIRAAISSHSGG